jgi:hypothetical protein
MSLTGLLLFADDGDVVFFLIVILFLVIGGLTQLFKKLQEAQDPRRPRPGGRPGGVRPHAGPGRDPVRDEIARFLQDAADRRGVGPRPAQRVGPQPARRVGPPPAAPQRPAPGGWPQRPAETPVLLEPIETVPEPASVAEHVRKQVPGQQFGGLTSDVGQRLARTGEVVQEHVHEVFDHQVGRLEGTPGESAYAAQAEEAETPEDRITALPQTAAAGLAAMLAEPVSLRQAIVLTEILQRPEHRWR